MAIHTTEVGVSTQGDGDAIDITSEVQRAVADAGAADGQASAFVRGSTAAITTMEFEPGGVADLKAMMERLVPARGDYEHNRLNHDTNSHAHQRASVVGPSLSVPVSRGRLALGTWQQIVLLDFDDRPRQRNRGRPGLLLNGKGPLSGPLCFRRTCHQRSFVPLARRSSSLGRRCDR
jgi:secondary thiamine-phosphate synthase enzyme